ncbi:hypothetical protein OAE79_00300 [Rhodopirellula sp.]|nr:hypothetical protein [Rhodopirellula sp.]MDB4678751.1 hypothetical protein [Rhodopirellula sp.]MDB4809829.1 hypothetical protein [bacterium]
MTTQNVSVTGVPVASDDRIESYSQYRAPSQHGQALVSPSLSEACLLIKKNRIALEQTATFQDMRREARRHLISSAVQYTAQYRDTSWTENAVKDTAPILMSGHQPTLFHSGVWFKNFALSHLAKITDAVPINILIDNDIAGGSSIRVPAIDPANSRGRYHSVNFDHSAGGIPYEQSTIEDKSCFDSFAERVLKTIQPLVPSPCVVDLWEHAKTARNQGNQIGKVLAQARHQLERDLGLETLEVPLSKLLSSHAYYEFAIEILSDLSRFHHCYNDSVMHYRAAHRIRSSSHPVPNLQAVDQWLEAPFWIYGNDDSQRRTAWIKSAKEGILISDRHHRECRINLSHPRAAAEQLHELTDDDFKIRPRALLTTMYARLILSDLFLHGIGGGKYDQLGDRITQSFFSVKPPEFTVLSATILLPGNADQDSCNRIPEVQRAIRDTEYQPERFSHEVDLASDLLREKNDLLQDLPAKGKRKTWHAAMENVNQKLAASLKFKRNALQKELDELLTAETTSGLLKNREHSFCLFEKEYLNGTFNDILRRF